MMFKCSEKYQISGGGGESAFELPMQTPFKVIRSFQSIAPIVCNQGRFSANSFHNRNNLDQLAGFCHLFEEKSAFKTRRMK